MHAYKVNRLRHTRPEWGPIIGDCLHNAASALDQLAYQLAILQAAGCLRALLAIPTSRSTEAVESSGRTFRSCKALDRT